MSLSSVVVSTGLEDDLAISIPRRVSNRVEIGRDAFGRPIRAVAGTATDSAGRVEKHPVLLLDAPERCTTVASCS